MPKNMKTPGGNKGSRKETLSKQKRSTGANGTARPSRNGQSTPIPAADLIDQPRELSSSGQAPLELPVEVPAMTPAAVARLGLVEAEVQPAQPVEAAAGVVASPDPGITMDKVMTRLVEWRWKPFLPDDEIVMLVGDPGAGKSTLLAAIAAQESGGPCIEAPRSRAPGRVLVYSSEGGLDKGLKPKLDAAGAMGGRIYSGDVGKDNKPLPPLSLPKDKAKLQRRIKESQISTVLFDPLTSYLDADFDINHAQQVRVLLLDLNRIASEECCLIVCTLHFRKNREGPPLTWVAGSAEWGRVPRVVIGLGHDPDRHDLRVLSLFKNSHVKELTSRLFTLPLVDGQPRFVIGGDSILTPDDLAAAGQSLADRDALAEAGVFLKDALDSGPVAVKDLMLAAQNSGHAWATVRRAKTKLGVVPQKAEGVKGGPWYWTKPENYLL